MALKFLKLNLAYNKINYSLNKFMGTTFGIVNPSLGSYTTRMTQLILCWHSIVKKISFRKPRFIIRIQTRQYGISLLCRGLACTYTIWVLGWKADSWFCVANLAIVISSFVIYYLLEARFSIIFLEICFLIITRKDTSAVVCLLFLDIGYCLEICNQEGAWSYPKMFIAEAVEKVLK